MTYDAGKQLVMRVFQENTALLHIYKECVPVESPNVINHVKQYHTPIRLAYKIITTEAPNLDVENAF